MKRLTTEKQNLKDDNMNIKKLFRKLFKICIECGCPNFDYSTKVSNCFCGCDIQGVTKEARKELEKK